MSHIRDLILSRLNNGLPGIHPKVGAVHAQACLVCFYEQNHSPGVILEVDGSFKTAFHVQWNETVTDQMLRSWRDPQETTEWGACGIAFLLILELTKYTVIERSRKGTGIDYWLTDRENEPVLPFQYSARLEVSGIREDEKAVKTRVRKKVKQSNVSDDSGLPAYIVVVEFSKPLSYVEKR
jgi:hypothetical protein